MRCLCRQKSLSKIIRKHRTFDRLRTYSNGRYDFFIFVLYFCPTNDTSNSTYRCSMAGNSDDRHSSFSQFSSSDLSSQSTSPSHTYLEWMQVRVELHWKRFGAQTLTVQFLSSQSSSGLQSFSPSHLNSSGMQRSLFGQWNLPAPQSLGPLRGSASSVATNNYQFPNITVTH